MRDVPRADYAKPILRVQILTYGIENALHYSEMNRPVNIQPSHHFSSKWFLITAILFAFCTFKALAVLGNLVGWGDGTYSPPSGVTNLTAIAAGQTQFPLGITSDSNVVRWPFGTAEPVGISNVTAIALGYDHGLALCPNGRVIGFGTSWYGDTSAPDELTNAVAVSAGYQCSLALKSDNSILAWGYNFFGQTNVPSNLTHVTAISMGPYHSLALKDNGTVVAWGYDTSGCADVPLGLSNVVAIAAGQNFSLAITSEGGIRAWGLDDLGQTDVPAGTSNVVAIAAGALHGLALKSDGTVIAWGYTNAGQTSVPPGLSNVVAIAAGGYCSLALTNNGSPSITWQAHSQEAYSGTSFNLGVGSVGTLPLSYQWLLNGVDIDNATNAWFAITNFSPADSGDYTVVITNYSGATTSSPATIQYAISGPLISQQPTNQSSVARDSITFSVSAEGSQPLSFQWQFNGSNLLDETDATLVLTNVQRSNAGVYQVIITNEWGTVASSNASLQFVPFQFSASPILQTNGLRLALTGCPANATELDVFSSTDLVSWKRIESFQFPLLPGTNPTFLIFDPSMTNQPFQFYRAQIR